MLNKLQLLILITCLSTTCFAQEILNGFSYNNSTAPTGKEWESPEDIALNKELPRAYFFSFQDEESAKKVLPENSEYYLSLNGKWKFNWVGNPHERPVDFYKPSYNVSNWDDITVPSNWNVVGLQKNGAQKYGTPIYANQPVIFQHKVAVDDWRGGVMRTPPKDWTTYKHRNEVGSYRRTFTVPQDWDSREVFISFDGVDSFFYLWINGQYIGFSKNSRNAARFNITPYLTEGENVVALEVYRNSDGSFLEAQDMFRLPGIFRSVAIYSTPQVQIRDLRVTPDLDKNYKDGELKIEADIKNYSSKNIKDYSISYKLYENEIYSDQTLPFAGLQASSELPDIKKSSSANGIKTTLSVSNPNKWSAEEPYRYTLVAQLKDKKGRVVETVSTYVGFREVEIKDTPASEDEFGLAGRYFYVNGKTVKLKGVNRHETSPEVGHAITREWMEKEVMLMKRANINHVRNAHYPDDPYWYYLCDKYGIYLEDEANIESHQYYYGDASLSHPIEWENAHVARVMEMAHSTINAPSIVIWSLGNEAGPGKNFVTAYNALKALDKSRPVQYERNNNIVDMGSNQYPSIAWMRGAVTGEYNIKYPFHVSEYAHSMGNACGNLVDYWDAIESTNFFMGGAIWDWIDQAIYNYTPDGTRYLAYGGDFGDKPNSGQFVMNGIVFADMQPKPQYFEVKKVYQYISAYAKDVEAGKFEIFNKNYFIDLSGYKIEWSLYENGKEVKDGDVTVGNIAPRTRKMVTLPYNFSDLAPENEYFVKIQFIQKGDSPWAKAGYVQAEEQFQIKEAQRPTIKQVAKSSAKLSISDDKSKEFKTIKGENFTAIFDLKQGTIYSLIYGGQKVIKDGEGPKLNALRAFTNNDNWFYQSWYANGLHNLRHKVTNHNMVKNQDGTIQLSFTVESQAPNGAQILGGTDSGRNSIEENTNVSFTDNDCKFTSNQIWTIYKDGSIELQSSISSNAQNLILPRLGYIMQVPKKYENFTYYGRGPENNYNDRKVGQFIEVHKSTVKEQFSPFPKPQDMGNHEDVRWCALTDNSGNGALFIATNKLSVSALEYTPLELTLAGHIYELPEPEDTYLTLDCAVTGLGGNSCGQGGPLTPDRVTATYNTVGFIIRPAGNNLIERANVSGAGLSPISIVRDRVGNVEILSESSDKKIMYTVNKGKKVTYNEKFNLAKGGTITAWYADAPNTKSTSNFGKIEYTPLVVVSSSSQESGEGDAKHLVDGNPNSIWHSMYSVTVAKHPHWVDFDAGSEKSIKGFTYLPRQNGSNGDVKDYAIYVSNDGENWSAEPIAKGTFNRDKKEKRVIFTKPVKARYIRFNALSEHNGQDFATGAEFTIITE